MDEAEEIYTLADAERDLLLGNDVDDYCDTEDETLCDVDNDCDMVDCFIGSDEQDLPYCDPTQSDDEDEE